MTTQKLYSSISDTPPPTRIYAQPAPIVDFAWYPTATPRDPASFCFVSSVRECPVKLLDASDGRLRASYPIIDHRERFIAPHSLAFNLTGQKLYCGFEDAIEVFDVGQPGEGTRLATTPSKKSKDGLKGIISALAFSPSYDSELFAAGSLTPTNGNIALFNESQGETPLMFVEGGPERAAGVTQLLFNPTQPHMLYASFRRRNQIYNWDLRATATSPVQIFDPELPSVISTDSERDPTKVFISEEMTTSRPEDLTNQKRRFDVDIGGRWLGVGSQEGMISAFETSTCDESSESHSAETTHVRPTLKWAAAKDSIGSVSFNPLSPLLLAVSGSRHFDQFSSQSESSDESDEDGNEHKYRYRAEKQKPVVKDSFVRIWEF